MPLKEIVLRGGKLKAGCCRAAAVPFAIPHFIQTLIPHGSDTAGPHSVSISGVYSSSSRNWKQQERNSVWYLHGSYRNILKARPFASENKELLSQPDRGQAFCQQKIVYYMDKINFKDLIGSSPKFTFSNCRKSNRLKISSGVQHFWSMAHSLVFFH